MIPTKFLSKLGVCDIKIHGLTLKVRVTDDSDIINVNGVPELKSQFGTTVVGLNLHTSLKSTTGRPSLLELCVGNRCLIIQLANLNEMPVGLDSFLKDKEICFVGINVGDPMTKLLSTWGYSNRTAEVSELVARFLMKPNLIGRGLEELASEVGVDLKNESASDEVKVNWEAKVFSEEEIKYAARNAHACYLIGKKIFG